MTTLVSLITKDSAVLGCDSLATATKPLVDPYELWDYFDDSENLKMDHDGQPVLKTIGDIYSKALEYPYNHMTHMEKLFSLAPLDIGVMTAGITGLGNRTIKSLISEFKDKKFLFKKKQESSSYTLENVGNNLMEYISPHYLNEHPEENGYRPQLEFILAGYSKGQQIPSTMRITFPDEKNELFYGEFGIMFGGQTKEIQRIIFGTNSDNKRLIAYRHADKLYKYHELLTDYLSERNITIELPDPEKYIDELHTFSDGWDLDQFDADWGNFSEQNAIECVYWLVEIMCKSQQFSSALPTVGGEINLAIITKSDGFRFLSKREYQVGSYSVPRDGGN